MHTFSQWSPTMIEQQKILNISSMQLWFVIPMHSSQSRALRGKEFHLIRWRQDVTVYATCGGDRSPSGSRHTPELHRQAFESSSRLLSSSHPWLIHALSASPYSVLPVAYSLYTLHMPTSLMASCSCEVGSGTPWRIPAILRELHNTLVSDVRGKMQKFSSFRCFLPRNSGINVFSSS